MKWTSAIKKIEKAMAEGKKVKIEYHRKWMPITYYGIVENVVDYEYQGERCKAVNTYHDGIDEYAHIIDDVIIEA